MQFQGHVRTLGVKHSRVVYTVSYVAYVQISEIFYIAFSKKKKKLWLLIKSNDINAALCLNKYLLLQVVFRFRAIIVVLLYALVDFSLTCFWL